MTQLTQRRIAIHFQRYGPYHKARLVSARQALITIGWEPIGLETASIDAVYQWQPECHPQQAGIHTVFPGKAAEQLSQQEICRSIYQVLNHLNPDAVAIAGWASHDAIACLEWCLERNKTALLMSETRAADGKRIWLKEAIKSWRVNQYHGALVGGGSHETYLRSLGFRGPIAHGYDVVDNQYFHKESSRWLANDQQSGPSIRPYILASNRFVQRKNLTLLLKAYAAVARLDSSTYGSAVDLCLLGDGPERSAIQSTCQVLNLPVVEAPPWRVEVNHISGSTGPRVFLPGFCQIEILPRFYAYACCFVHPAISEPWGLVINEAMASGLPVLCSANTGAAEELVVEGLNGMTFNPLDVNSISRALSRFLCQDMSTNAYWGQASFHILEKRCPLASFGNGLASLLLHEA